jgi:hypothetical protein
MRLTGVDIPLIFRINQWLQHDGAPSHFSRNVQSTSILNRILIVRSDEVVHATGLNDLRTSIVWIFSYGGT